eukprot:758684-Hanusia_phi.AAC.2
MSVINCTLLFNRITESGPAHPELVCNTTSKTRLFILVSPRVVRQIASCQTLFQGNRAEVP